MAKYLVLWLMFALLSMAGALHAADRHVAMAGNGPLGFPNRTIQKMDRPGVAGDNALIRPGTYRETVRAANSGNAGAHIIFSADPALDDSPAQMSPPHE